MKLRTFLLSSLVLLAAVAAAAQTPQPSSSSTSAATAVRSSVNSPSPSQATSRESELAKAVEKQERRHFEMHRFYIPLTQGNLQWLAAMVGAKPEEAALVWKLMRDWDGARWTSVVSGTTRNPS